MTAITCVCGAVRLEAEAGPILSTVCHCASCRGAGRMLDAASGQNPVVDASGGTALVLWRKDRVRCVAGGELLETHRLTAGSPTRRLVASCCKAPVLLDFTKGFWVSLYRDRVADAPPPSIRIMTRDVPEDMSLPDDGLPRVRGYSGRFMIRLLAAWAMMRFRTPRIVGLGDR